MPPSAIDWSEFHVWCFLLQDVNKLAARTKSSEPAVVSSSSMAFTFQNSPVMTSQVAPSESAGTVGTGPWSTSPIQSMKASKAGITVTSSLRPIVSPVILITSFQPTLLQTMTPSSVEEKLSTTTAHTHTKVASHFSATTGSKHTSTAFLAYAQFAAGALGGCVATYTTHWLDTIKVRMQTSPDLYANGLSCLRHTLRQEGVRGLYLGSTPAVLGQTCKTAVVFMCYGLCEELVRRLTDHENVEELSAWQHAGAGAMTGVAASFVLCPLELLKCRLQALQQVTKTPACSATQIMSAAPVATQLTSEVGERSTRPLAMARYILRSDGPRGLYRGLPGIWVKEVPGSFIYFGSYEAAKSAMKHLSQTEHLSSRAVFLCGVFAGLCFCVTHPIESVKTRVQVMSAISEYRGFISALVHIVRTEGVKPLCSGIRPSMLRACVYSGIQFVVYELAKDIFLEHHQRRA